MKKLAVLLMVVLLLSGCTSQKAASSEKQPASSAAQSSESKAESEEPEESKEPEPETNYLEMGTEGTLGDWGINVKSMEIMDSIKNGDYFSFNPDEGNSYLVVNVSISNNGKTAEDFLPVVALKSDVSVKITYGDGYEFKSTNLLGYDQELHGSNLNPLTSKEGIIAFEVPESVVSSDDEILVCFDKGKEELACKVR